jgi:hypothetical protein
MIHNVNDLYNIFMNENMYYINIYKHTGKFLNKNNYTHEICNNFLDVD